MRRTLLLLLLLALPSPAPAADQLLDQPHWSLEVKGGVFSPKLEDFSRYYGGSTMPEFAAALAYKVRPWAEVGAEAGALWAKGQAQAVVHGTTAGSVDYELYPVNLFVLLRGLVKEDQWLIPYIGGGWTRMYYRQTVRDQGTVSGSADGYHVRGGLQLSLNELDRSASSSMYATYGVLRTSFILEAERITATESTTSTDLGGTSYRAGLLLEF